MKKQFAQNYGCETDTRVPQNVLNLVLRFFFKFRREGPFPNLEDKLLPMPQSPQCINATAILWAQPLLKGLWESTYFPQVRHPFAVAFHCPTRGRTVIKSRLMKLVDVPPLRGLLQRSQQQV